MKKQFLFLSIMLLAGCKAPVNLPDKEQVHYEMQRSANRGVSYKFNTATASSDMAVLAPGVSWFYNWGQNVGAEVENAANYNGLEFLPMAFSGVYAEGLRIFKESHPNCNYVLAFNEPNLTDQANMTPAAAAQKWQPLLDITAELNMKIVSPAMNYGTLAGYGDPIKWLDDFFTFVNPDDIYAIAIHCYMGNAGGLKSFVELFKKYGKPIWVTEFCAWENVAGARQQMEYMSNAVAYLELDPDVERYAWFMPRYNDNDVYPYMQLLLQGEPLLTDCGQVYANMSSFDKKFYSLANTQIEAEQMSNCNISDKIGQTGFSNSVFYRPTTDSEGGLDIYNFANNMWIEYQIEMKETKNYTLSLRCNAENETNITLYIDGDIADFITLNQSDWNTYTMPIHINEGRHTLRIEVTEGVCALNWLKFE
jgi:hypothetical protein